LGNIAPEQSDYHQVVWGGGHGSYKNIVLAPNSAQEMSDLTQLAFELADKYRNPVFVLADGAIGQMMEPVEFPDDVTVPPAKPWSVDTDSASNDNLISSIFLDGDELEAHTLELYKKYQAMEKDEVRFDEYEVEGAEVVCIAYGIMARVMRSAVAAARREGIKAGLLRPITLWPFIDRRIGELAESDRVRCFLDVEMSAGQMVKDVRLAVEGRKPVEFFGRLGGNIPTVPEAMEAIKRVAG